MENTGNISAEELLSDENRKAEEAIANGDFTSAAKILVPLVEKDPLNWRAFNNLGIISWAQKAWFDAFAMFKKSTEIKADYTDALINLFDAALKLKRVGDVLPSFNKAVEINPTLEEIRIIRDNIIEQGDQIYSSKRALAIGFYSPIIEEAEKELEKGNLFKAMEKFIQSNDSEGPSAAAYCGLGIISFYQQKYSDAFTLFIESIKLNPSDPDTFLNLLDAAKECGHLEDAGKIYNIYKNDFPALETIADEFNKYR